jgi:hypothetical protein
MDGNLLTDSGEPVVHCLRYFKKTLSNSGHFIFKRFERLERLVGRHNRRVLHAILMVRRGARAVGVARTAAS